MKKLVAIIILTAFVYSCSWFEDDEENFIQAYKEVLIIRVTEDDSTKAIKKIEKALKQKGYTSEEFYERMEEYANNGEKYLAILDSVRVRAKNEIVELREKKIDSVKTKSKTNGEITDTAKSKKRSKNNKKNKDSLRTNENE